MPTPRARRPRSTANSSSTSCCGRLAVGSSSTSTCGLDAERAGDGDERFLRAGQVADTRCRGSMSWATRPASGGRWRSTSRQSTRPRRRGIALREGDVLGHGHPLDEAEVLVDEGDLARRAAGIVGRARAGHPAGIGLVDAGQHLDQRRLAGAVLAEQRQDLAGLRSRSTPSTASVPPNRLLTPAKRSKGPPARLATARGPPACHALGQSLVLPDYLRRSWPRATGPCKPVRRGTRVGRLGGMRASAGRPSTTRLKRGQQGGHDPIGDAGSPAPWLASADPGLDQRTSCRCSGGHRAGAGVDVRPGILYGRHHALQDRHEALEVEELVERHET